MINIYKASAGSGKTHKLTGEYIKLLFSQPNAYKHILAVTFTNKATDEMKQRILKELYTLSCNNKDSDYLKDILEFTNKDETWVRERAKKILVEILHNYSSFYVSTIDKFFQSIMRAFARELGKMATYNVELDKNTVLLNAVDRMFSDLDNPENKKLLQWLIEYSLDAIDKGESWNVKGEILRLADQLFKENFKLIKKECNNDTSIDNIWNLKKELKSNLQLFENKIIRIASQGVDIINKYSLDVTAFKGGSRTPFKYLFNLKNWKGLDIIPPPTDSFISLQDDIEKWYTGKVCPAAINSVYSELNDVIGKLLDEFDTNFNNYCSDFVVLSNINALGILNDIYIRILDYCKEKNIILLSESTELLNQIIDGSDTPFIYEKIGARLDNFMLDEFQDTSFMQWKNFYPLLENSLAQGKENLIVGDIKQSIYRWRGSDWKILKDNIYREFRDDEIQDFSLDCNWRSGANIVEFNNDFFAYCAKEAQSIADLDEERIVEQIYNNFKQEIPDKMRNNPGYVELNFVNDEEDGFEENVLKLLPAKIKELLDAGYKQKDIAILIRKKKQGNGLALTLLEAGYDIISSDSLTIGSSIAVQKIVNILRQIDNPNSNSLLLYKKFIDIPEINHIKMFSLYQLCESIIRESLTDKERSEVAFLQAFLDSVLEFTNREGTNISQFLKWCDNGGLDKAISAPEDLDAIRIMTIHKSKGLGFKIVIIPFLLEGLDHSSLLAPTLWCKYNNMAVPVKYVQGLLNTNFINEYLNEKISYLIDSLNTVYVAFTRPKHELIVFAKETKKTKSGAYESPKNVSDILFLYYLEKVGNNLPDDGIMKYVIGEHNVDVNSEEDTSDKVEISNVFSTPLNEKRTKAVAHSGIIGEEESIREHGIIMHYVFSLIQTENDVENAVKQAYTESVSNMDYKELLTLIKRKLDSVKQYNWFSPQNQTLNECSILTKNGEELRPDRVIINGSQATIIDYKFGGYPKEDHRQSNIYKKQVNTYKQLISQMGYTNVKGYLWYITADVVEEVL